MLQYGIKLLNTGAARDGTEVAYGPPGGSLAGPLASKVICPGSGFRELGAPLTGTSDTILEK